MADRTGSIRIDQQGVVSSMDKEAVRLWGSDLSGRPVHDLFTGTVDGWLPRESDAVARRADGSELPIGFQWRPGSDGSELCVWDAEAERREEERIHRSEAQLREAQEVGRIGSWVWDIVNDDITWSDELYRMYGLEPQQFPATFEAYIERIHPDDRELAQSVVQQAFQDMGPFSFDHRLVRPDGEVRWLHGQGAVEVKDGKPARMYGVSQDITAQREAEEAEKRALEKELEVEHYKRLDESRRMLINSMAHELHTPLTPMRLQLGLLRSGAGGDLTEQQATSLEILTRNATRLEALVSDLLDVARMDSGTLQLHREEMDLTDIIRQTVDTFRPQAEAEGILVEVDVPDAMEITADRGRLTQVLYNLVSNAIKFSRKGQTVTLRAEQQDAGPIISVQDQGLGMDTDQISRLFRPFVRVHDDPDRPGNGLGLHISKGLVEAHGGDLVVESAGPDQGSTFTVSLPTEAVAVTA